MHRNDRMIIFLGIIIVVIALVGAAVGGSPKVKKDGEDEEDDYTKWPIKDSDVKHISGSSSENSDETVIFNITDKYVLRITYELNWLDEADTTGLGDYTNQPDSFNFTVLTPWEEAFSSDNVFNPQGNAGLITETIEIPEEVIKDGAIGEWTLMIHCGECGDQTPRVSLGGYRDIQDTGNDWILTRYYEFHTNN